MYFNDDDTANLKTRSMDFRFTQPHAIIFGVQCQDWVTLHYYYEYAMYPRNVVILFQLDDSNTNLISSPGKYLLPLYGAYISLKLLVRRGGAGDTGVEYKFSVVCHSYCIQSQHDNYSVGGDLQVALESPEQYHKKLFRNSNQRTILSWINGVDSGYFYKSTFAQRRTQCAGWVLTSKLMLNCVYDLMIPIILGQVHNATINIHTNFIVNEARTSIFAGDQDMGYHTMNYQTNNEPTISGYRFANSITEYAWYCVEPVSDSSSFMVSVWVSGFNSYTWLLIAGLVVIGACIFVVLHRRDLVFDKGLLVHYLLQITSILFGQGVTMSSKSIVVVMFATFILSNLYGNSITSLLVAPTPYQPYSTVSEAITSGYKIAWLKYYKPEARAAFAASAPSHLRERHEDIFFAVKDTFIQWSPELNQNKILKISSSGYIDVIRTLAKSRMNNLSNHTSVFECPYISQPIISTMALWYMFTVNRDWFAETIIRIRESGLAFKFDEWSSWADYLNVHKIPKEFAKHQDPQHQLIHYQQFFAPSVLFLVLLGITCLVFFHEVRANLKELLHTLMIRTGFLFRIIFWRGTKVIRIS